MRCIGGDLASLVFGASAHLDELGRHKAGNRLATGSGDGVDCYADGGRIVFGFEALGFGHVACVPRHEAGWSFPPSLVGVKRSSSILLARARARCYCYVTVTVTVRRRSIDTVGIPDRYPIDRVSMPRHIVRKILAPGRRKFRDLGECAVSQLRRHGKSNAVMAPPNAHPDCRRRCVEPNNVEVDKTTQDVGHLLRCPSHFRRREARHDAVRADDVRVRGSQQIQERRLVLLGQVRELWIAPETVVDRSLPHYRAPLLRRTRSSFSDGPRLAT